MPVVMTLNAIMLSVAMLSLILLSVMVPITTCKHLCLWVILVVEEPEKVSGLAGKGQSVGKWQTL